MESGQQQHPVREFCESLYEAAERGRLSSKDKIKLAG